MKLQFKYLLITFFIGFLLNCNSKKSESTNKNIILKLSKNYKAMLENSSTGWSYQIWDKEQLVISESGGFRIAKIDSKDGASVEFNSNQRMHVASISKTITALAVAKILDSKNINWDAKIAKFLPQNWHVHSSLENTTFADLLEMKSGLVASNNAISSSYYSLKEIVEKGVKNEDIGKFNYQNISYGLLRVLIAELNDFNFNRISSDSITLETASANSYVNYVNEMILKPAHIPFASCRELSDSPTLMYPFPHNSEQGLITGFSGLENSNGDLTNYSGGLGWYLSVNDLGKLYSTFYNTNKILSKKTKNSLLERSYPFNKGKREWGEYSSGMGMWIWSKPHTNYNCGLNTVYVYFPNDILLVAFVNSKGKGIKNLKAKSILAYEKSL